MKTIRLAGEGVTIGDIAAVARQDAQVAADERVIARLVEARLILESAAASGQQIYGMNTALGANLKTAVTEDFAAFQLQLVRGRSVSVGAALPREKARAITVSYTHLTLPTIYSV